MSERMRDGAPVGPILRLCHNQYILYFSGKIDFKLVFRADETL